MILAYTGNTGTIWRPARARAEKGGESVIYFAPIFQNDLRRGRAGRMLYFKKARRDAMTTAAQTLIRQSVRENVTVRTTDTSVCDDLLAECADDCDTYESQIGVTADGLPRMGVHYWGTTDSGFDWSVLVELAD